VNNFRIVDRLRNDHDVEQRALLRGLRTSPASITPKYFYDALGCALFGAICELPEYYPTRTERAIFGEHHAAIVHSMGTGRQFVDLGAGDGRKARAWLPVVHPTRYVAVDVAGAALRETLSVMAPDFPQVEMLGVVTDFAAGLDLDGDLEAGPATFFYPGSSIGNFAPDAALGFLQAVHRHCAARPGSSLLIGVDTKKDKARLDAAYDDALGVTAAFNRNVLNHVNRVLGCDFDPAGFAHRGFYNAAEGRVEMHLEAMATQTVTLPDGPLVIAEGGRIHTENSYKYAPAEFSAILDAAGFASIECWQDARGDFAVFYAA
jgi:L-histidine Nalpha-methyltransferase